MLKNIKTSAINELESFSRYKTCALDEQKNKCFDYFKGYFVISFF